MKTCPHLDVVARRDRGVTPASQGCQQCLDIGSEWVNLRLCLTCGHVGCCDNSPNKHATKHFHATTHPVIRSYEPGEEWGYCFPDGAFVEQVRACEGEAAERHYEAPGKP